jgi:predicted  nucleic acid-binding Zn-ribbon protein
MGTEMSGGLSTLHSLLLQLAEAESRLTDGPRMIGVSERQIVAVEQQMEKQKQAIKDARKSADDINLKLKTKESEILKLEGQLNVASSNKEYEIIRNQIANAKRDRGEIEEQGLLALEAVDTANGKMKELEAELQKRKQQLQTIRNGFENDKPQLQAGVQLLQQQIAEAEKVIPGNQMATWQRLRAAHGPGALSPLEDDFCKECSTRVTNQDQVRLRTGEFLCCRDCGRALYSPG